tara:strand:+ start:4544 stop:6583 length:2040 start_codon:yes stop_codon:yes gene_type:complete
MRNPKDDNDGTARSLFLAGLMIGSVLVGGLFYDFESEGINLAPIIESDVPDSILIGSVEFLHVSISDEDMSSLDIEATLDGSPLLLAPNNTGIISVDISELGVGTHSLKIIIIDSLGQESRLSSTFLVHHPYEDPTIIIVDDNEISIIRGDVVSINGTLIHPNIGTCNLGWSDGDASQFSLNLPFTEDGDFSWGPSEIESNISISIIGECGTWEDSSDLETIVITVIEPIMGCTDPEANNYNINATNDDGNCQYDQAPPVVGCMDSQAINYDSNATQDDGSCEYETNNPETGSSAWWAQILLCDDGLVPVVDDYTTDDADNHECHLSFIIEDENITISANGLPNHDFESTLGCCANSQSDTYIIPLNPIDDAECNPSVSSDGCVMAPIRGTIAFTVTGVAIYGPEEGDGGDAVALEEGAYEQEDGEQPVDLGVCHGHSGPGGIYHYHADSNCIHWHAEEGETMYDYNLESQRTLSTHSKIVGFALDGYSIYGYTGWNDDGEVVEMTSSYKLKEGADGSGGIDDYEYIQGLGTLDACNGIFSATPDWPEGMYHYHTTMINGEGGIGFPYFINCYAGELPQSDENGDDGDDPCTGHGETWGPGIGPPPDGCGGGSPGGQSSEGGLIAIPWLKNPPNSGLIMISFLMLATVGRYSLRGLASEPSALSLVGKVHEYRLTQELA